MTCDVDEATVNGTSALPVLACRGRDHVLVVDADGRGEHREPRRGDPAGLPAAGAAPRSTWRTRTPTRSPAARPATSCTPTSSTTCRPGSATTGWKVPAASAGARATTRCARSPVRVQGGSGDDLIVGAPAGSHRRRQRLRHGRDRLLGLHQPNKPSGWRSPTRPSTARSRPPASRRTTSRRPTAGWRTASTAGSTAAGSASTAAPATTPSWADRERTWPTSVSATTWSTPAPAPTSSWPATVTTRSRPATASATWWSAARAPTRSPPTGPTCSAAARTSLCPAPETSRIDGPKKVTKGTKAFFTFAASVASATFECQVDTGAYKLCASPFKVKTKKLKTGKHTLTVRAVQPAGNADPTPSIVHSSRCKAKK